MSDQDAPTDVEGLWPDRVTGPYRLRVWFGRVGGRPAVVGLELWGVEPQDRPWGAAGMTAGEEYAMVDGRLTQVAPEDRRKSAEVKLPDTAIRADDVRLPLGAMLDEHVAWEAALAKAALQATFLAPAETWPKMPQLARAREEAFARAKGSAERILEQPAPRRRGRKPLDDVVLAEAAQIYQEAWDRGDRAQAKATARELHLRGYKVSEGTVKRWLVIARDRGLLEVGGTKWRGTREEP